LIEQSVPLHPHAAEKAGGMRQRPGVDKDTIAQGSPGRSMEDA
jgi:hypothetical protein